ncbi:hypothetical protein ACFQ0O_19215 [Saccharopolyspora spinosporotrichia]
MLGEEPGDPGGLVPAPDDQRRFDQPAAAVGRPQQPVRRATRGDQRARGEQRQQHGRSRSGPRQQHRHRQQRRHRDPGCLVGHPQADPQPVLALTGEHGQDRQAVGGPGRHRHLREHRRHHHRHQIGDRQRRRLHHPRGPRVARVLAGERGQRGGEAAVLGSQAGALIYRRLPPPCGGSAAPTAAR